MTDLLLEATGVAKHYGAVAALRSASLAVRAGEVHALMGANGAGKSTLVKILTGAVHPDGGSIPVRGEPYSPDSPAEARRGGIVSVYQEPALVPDLDITSNLRLTQDPGRAVPPLAGRARHRRPRPLGHGPRPAARHPARHRPGPCARHRAHVLMLDEMTAALPADLTERVLQVIGGSAGRTAASSSSRTA